MTMRQNNGIKIVWDDDLYDRIDDLLNPKLPMPKRKTDTDTRVYFNAKQKVYPDGNVELKRYKFVSAYREDGYEIVKSKLEVETDERISKIDKVPHVKKPVEKPQEEIDKKILDNIQLTRNKIYDIAGSNDWTHFITLTYNSAVCDRHSFADTSKRIRRFMHNFGQRNKLTCPNFKYLIIPECHKDGAYHYHGLIYLEDDTSMVDSGKRTKKEQPILNWSKWLNGYSTATVIDNLNACTKYITKYVTKAIGEDYQKGQRRFYYSSNCAKPIVRRLYIDDEYLTGYDKTYESEVSIGYDSDLDTILMDKYGIDSKALLDGDFVKE